MMSTGGAGLQQGRACLLSGTATAGKRQDLTPFSFVELEPEGRALQQIKDRGYADKYRADGQPIHLIGMEFSREQRAVVGFEVETR